MEINKQELKLQITKLVKKHAPEGTSDEEIEKQIARVTAAVLRALGTVGRKLKSLIGRVIQRFQGKEGVWITRGGKRIFIPVKDAKAAAAAVGKRPPTLLEREATAAARRGRKAATRAKDPITASIRRDAAAARKFKSNFKRNFRNNARDGLTGQVGDNALEATGTAAVNGVVSFIETLIG